jgi:hypothetical protein
LDELSTIISTIGFPIFSFLISAWFIKYTYDTLIAREKENDKRNESHWEQLAQLTQAVNENSQALRDMIKMIDENKIL